MKKNPKNPSRKTSRKTPPNPSSTKTTLTFIILIILISILLSFPLKFASNYIHEQAHIREAEKQNISLNMNPFTYEKGNFLKTFGQAKAVPLTKEDCEKFNSLKTEEKEKITHAGVKHEVLSFLPLIALCTLLLILLNKKKIKHNYLINLILLSIILISLAIIVVSLNSNVYTSNPLADWNVFSMDCSGF